MGDFLTKEEHNEYVRRVDAEDERQNKRLGEVEKIVDKINDLTVNVAKLAQNMEGMIEGQKRQSERLERLERKDGEMWRVVVTCVVTAIVSGWIGTLL